MKEHDPTDLRGEEKRSEDIQLQAKVESLSEAEDIKWIMSSKRGRRIVRRLLEKAGVNRISFNTNAMQMAFNEGNRNQGNQLLAAALEHAPSKYIEMLEGN